MKLMTTTAVLFAAGFAAVPAVAQSYGPSSTPQQAPEPRNDAPAASAQAQGQGPKINVSAKATKAVQELQAAVKANDRANIPAKVAAAQAVAQTRDDRFAIARLQLDAAFAANDNAAALTAADALVASAFLPASDVAGVYTKVGVSAYNAKQYDQAVGAFQKAVALNGNDAEAVKFLGMAQNMAGHKAEASATMLRAIQLGSAGGKKPDEDLYKQALTVAYAAKAPTAIELGRQWVAAYPSPDSWHDALVIYRSMGNPDPSLALDVMRLTSVTNAMRGTADYNIYAGETINSQNYGEAKALISEGLSSGRIKASDPIVQDIQKALAGKSAPTAAELTTRESAAKAPTAFLRVGDAYYGAGNYQKAAELYRKAIAGGADKNVANLRLGEALARAGDKAGATAALTAVSGTQAEIAKFWLLYVQRQG
ncbi:MAG: tetratricopeptide repeat protein [Bradyrhizobium sp.]